MTKNAGHKNEKIALSKAQAEMPALEVSHLCESSELQRRWRYSVGLTAAACGMTAATILIPGQFQSREDRTCWRTLPPCNPRILRPLTCLPAALRAAYSCEVLLLLIAIATVVHWACIWGLFRQDHWREQHLPLVIAIALAASVPAGWVLSDGPAVFIQAVPCVVDICAVACLLLDCFSPAIALAP